MNVCHIILFNGEIRRYVVSRVYIEIVHTANPCKLKTDVKKSDNQTNEYDIIGEISLDSTFIETFTSSVASFLGPPSCSMLHAFLYAFLHVSLKAGRA